MSLQGASNPGFLPPPKSSHVYRWRFPVHYPEMALLLVCLKDDDLPGEGGDHVIGCARAWAAYLPYGR